MQKYAAEFIGTFFLILTIGPRGLPPAPVSSRRSRSGPC
jgi:hypothetical protein